MNIWKKIPLTLKILLPGIAIVITVATAKPKPKATPPEPVLIDKTQVHVINVEKKSQSVSIKTQGIVQPIRSSELMSQLHGEIVYVAPEFADGGSFVANQVLLKIDDTDYKLALISAEAELADAKMQFDIEVAQSKKATKEWKELGDDSANRLFKREPQLTTIKTKLNVAQARLEKAKYDLTRTNVSLPFTGRIESTLVGVGQFISSATSLAKVFDTSVLQVKLPLTEQQAALVNLPIQANNVNQTHVTLKVLFGGDIHHWTAFVSRTSASLDRRTQMLGLIVDIPAEQQLSDSELPLFIGLFVEAEIPSKIIKDLIELPKGAVFKRDYVYHITDEEKVAQSQVEVISRDANSIWIKSDNLNNGNNIIVNKLGFLSPGTDVVAVDQEYVELAQGGE